ncbi:MAG: hypothetical protein IKZ46_04465 [Victivallales bacterium]|nr:hypothetical protein [Victivallales bacterium]
MKNMRLICSLFLIGCMACWGFLPPVDQKNGVKLSIDGIPETAVLSEGVLFKVIAENESDKTVTVAMQVWMNDDWKTTPGRVVAPFELAPKGKQEFEFKGAALDRALEAWYPVHAQANVTPQDGEAFALHPIALFKTKKARAQQEAEAAGPESEDQTAWFAEKGVTVDGDLDEWWGQATPVSCGSERLSAGKISGDSFDGVVMFLHDKENIYIAGQFVDDDISCEDKTSDDFMDSDYLRFYFHGMEPAKRQDTAFTDADKVIAVNVFGGADEQIRVDKDGEPLLDDDEQPIVDIVERPMMKVPKYVGGEKKIVVPPGFKIVTRRTGVGYVFEANLPKSVIGAEAAKAIGMNLMIGDADGKIRRSEVYFGRRISNYWLTPKSYFRLALAGPRGARPVADYSPETITMHRANIRLDRSVSRRVAYRTVGAEAETVMARGFDGNDPNSGLVMQNRKGVDRRNDVRDALVFHPPFKTGAGYVKATYRIQLPEKNEAMFTFATALRDHQDGEAPSDGVEYIVEVQDAGKTRRLFRRSSATKTWEAAEIDLREFMGRTIDLSLIVTPGAKNNTSCDECYWADPQISLKDHFRMETKIDKDERRSKAIAMARLGLKGKVKKSAASMKPGRNELQTTELEVEGMVWPGCYQLKSADGTVYGAALLPGPEGIVDSFLAFVDKEEHVLVYEGFSINVAGVLYGQSRQGEPITWLGQDIKYGRDIYRHQIETEQYGTVMLEVRVRPYGGTLQISFAMPGVERDLRGQPRYTKLAIGKGNEKPWRIYGGFGNVIEDPKDDFVLSRGGFTLNTRHVGVDYRNKMSLSIASDFFPDRMVCKPSENLFTLEAHNDVTFHFAPSSKNAFMAAKEYGRVVGFKPSPGLDELLGRQCLDQWSGDYEAAAEGVRMAAKYGMEHSIFVKHVWQRWGYDYRLPEIYPPMGGLEPFKKLSDACQENGIIFAPHDNYIDFYPDAEGFSYDHIIFNADGTPQRAWYNKGRDAQSYRWLPHAFKPWLVKNMELIRDNIGAHGLFIDVFSAIPPMDYYDRSGRFYESKRTAKEWSAAFDTCREILWKDKGPMLSECGHDALIGSLDGGQADHYSGNRWGAEKDKWERVPWHDIVSHGKFVLLGGGLGSRYAENDPAPSGYGSDNYNSMTVIGGRNPMSDGPFSTSAVKTYWMLHDVCDWLARQKIDTLDFGILLPVENMMNDEAHKAIPETHKAAYEKDDASKSFDEILEKAEEKVKASDRHLLTSIHRLHAVFGEGEEKADIWCNRADEPWRLKREIVMKPSEIQAYKEARPDEWGEEQKEETQTSEAEQKKESSKKKEKKLPRSVLPKFGYYINAPDMTVYVVEKDGMTMGYSRKGDCVFYDARPPYTSILSKQNITAMVKSLKKVSDLVFEMNVEWDFEKGSTAERASQFIHVTHPSSKQGEGILYYGTVEKTDVNHTKPGIYHSTIKVALPEDVPDGELKILFGIFNPQNGGRLGITGVRMEGNRVFGGAIQVSRNADGKITTTITKVPQQNNVDTLELPMADFDDGVKTNGSFRWIRLGERRWRLIPVPGSLPFRVEGSQKVLAGLDDSKLVSVTMVDPWTSMAQKPVARLIDGNLTLEVDGRAFAYDVEFKKER